MHYTVWTDSAERQLSNMVGNLPGSLRLDARELNHLGKRLRWEGAVLMTNRDPYRVIEIKGRCPTFKRASRSRWTSRGATGGKPRYKPKDIDRPRSSILLLVSNAGFSKC